MCLNALGHLGIYGGFFISFFVYLLLFPAFCLFVAFFSIDFEDNILPGILYEILDEVGNDKPAGLVWCLEVPFPLCNSVFFEGSRVVLM